MTIDAHAAIEPHADRSEVVRKIHDVPPHEVYEVRLDGTRAVCKLARGPEADLAIEGRVLDHVRRRTSVPVPRVLGMGDGYFVAEWRDGAPKDPTLTSDRVRAMGAGLATLHVETGFDAPGQFAIEPARNGGSAIGRAGASDDALAVEARDSWPAALCDPLADCRALLESHRHADVADEAIAFLRAHPDALAGAGDPVLIHGNYLLDHVGVADGEVTCVLDFEHAFAGAGEYDYWATALPTFRGSDGAVATESLAAFREGYESVRPLRPGFDRRAPVYRAVLGVTYLRSLYLQRNWESRTEADQRADGTAEFVRSELDRSRAALE